MDRSERFVLPLKHRKLLVFDTVESVFSWHFQLNFNYHVKNK